MELRQLEMLLAVAEEGSYVRAGQKLNISHSAIHRQVRLLEDEVQEHILVRTGRKVELTEAGQLMVALCRRILRDIAQTSLEVRGLSTLQSGTLRIGTGTTMLVFFLPEVLHRLRTEFPGIAVHLSTGTADRVIEGIEAGTLDAGIIFSPSDLIDRHRSLRYELLYQEEFVFAVGKGHPLAKRRRVDLHDITAFPFITFSKTSYVRHTIERIFQRAGVSPSITMELENEEAIEKMIEINMGVAALSKRRAVSDRVHYLTVREHVVNCDVRMIYPNAGYLPPATREFLRVCREVSGGTGGQPGLLRKKQPLRRVAQ